MRVPRFHIFLGFRDKDPLWLDSVQGLGAANERMKRLAAEKAGRYFIFSTDTYNVVASIDTSIQNDMVRAGVLSAPNEVRG
jgi:hypothetical protein